MNTTAKKWTRFFLFVFVVHSAVAFPHKALWLSNTEELIARPKLRDTLLWVRDELNIKDVFLNFPHRFEFGENGVYCELLQEDSIAVLVQWASAHGFRIFALAGEPEWVLPKFLNHAEAFIQAILQFARNAPVNGAISGIHIDVEPHLLIQFASPVLQIDLYRNMIQLHRRLAELVHSNSSLEYGADVAFWMRDTVRAGGIKASVLQHVLQDVDHLSVLAYRDKAEGVNGILALAEDHVAMAEVIGKQVYVGVETQELHSRVFRFILGKSESDFRAALTGRCRDVPSVINGGDRIVALDVFGTVYVGVSRMATPEGLLHLVDCFGQSIDHMDTTLVQEKLNVLRFWSRHIGEWESPKLDTVIERGGERYLTISMREKKLSHVSFSEESFSYFRTEVAKLDSAYRGRPSYRGVAVHDFQGALRLILKN